MAFFQTPPRLTNTYESDALLRSIIERQVPAEVRAHIEPSLQQMGQIAADLHAREVAEGRQEPRLVSFDPWGRRINRIELTPFWQEMARIAAEQGLVATAYEQKTGEYARLHQFALVYLFEPSSQSYSCPLAMTDGAARILSQSSADPNLRARALPHLLSRDPSFMWTSGQWMTERTGGSDVGASETLARKQGDSWHLYGTKWFTSAATSEIALTLARPEGNPPGGRGLALFYLEPRHRDGSMNHIQVLRLKDKLGTRMLPTAELLLEGTVATPVNGLTDGVKNISPMLMITRLWNAVAAVGGGGRLFQLAVDYAKKRIAFAAPLSQKPLHTDTLAWAGAEHAAALLLVMRCVQLLGQEEARTLTEGESQLLRLLVPIAKLTTAKQSVAIASELIEAFGGAGYVEDTGLPRYLRDAQVLPIWEGTTNVLSLDVLRVLQKGGTLQPLFDELSRCTHNIKDTSLASAAAIARNALTHAHAWLVSAAETPRVEAGARRFALTLGRALELALLVDHAQWELDRNRPRTCAAARRMARTPIDLVLDDLPLSDATLLLQ